MARVGDEIYGWTVEELAHWLHSEGLDDCIQSFTYKRIDGCKLLTLTDSDIKNLHISRESARKLIKVVEKIKRRRKGKIDKMFGNNVQTVTTRKPSSFSHDDGASDSDDGWGSDEWEEDSEYEDSSGDGEYLEPEDDFSQPSPGSPLKKDQSLFQHGLVAQLREGIAESLKMPQHNEDDEDIYDVPPDDEVETEDVYEVPSDSSGGAVVVRPPAKPPRMENATSYLQTKEEDTQDMYEDPMEGEGISMPPTSQQRFMPTQIEPQGNQAENQEINEDTYDVAEIPSDDEQYEVSPKPVDADPPPRPPKGTPGKAAPLPSKTPARPPKQIAQASLNNTAPQKIVYKKSPQSTPSSQGESSFQRKTFPQQRAPPSSANLPSSQSRHNPNQIGPTVYRKPPPNNTTNQETAKDSNCITFQSTASYPQRPPHGGPTSPGHRSSKPVPTPTKPNFSPQGTQFQGMPKQPQISPKPQIAGAKPKPSLNQPKANEVPSSSIAPTAPRPRPTHIDLSKREPAPLPGQNSVETSGPEATKRPDLPRKVSDPQGMSRFGPKPGAQTPQIPAKNQGRRPLPSPGQGGQETNKRPDRPRKASDPPSPRHFEQKTEVQTPKFPAQSGPNPSQLSRPVPSAQGAPPASEISKRPNRARTVSDPPSPDKLVHSKAATPALPKARRCGPLPSAPDQQRLPEPEPSPPPRPPKQGGSQPPLVPMDKKNVPLPAAPSSNSSLSYSKEQSSGSSMESGSADDPVVPLPKRPPNRNLPPTPNEIKSAHEMMKEAPWFHGGVDKKTAGANLRAVNMDGAFLVRNSSRNPNDYSLSLLHHGEVRHLKIPKKDGQYVLGASGVQKFESILDLIRYYQQNEVDLMRGGTTKLTVHAQNLSR